MSLYLNCLVEYHYWANARILRATADVSAEQFTTQVFPHHNSLRGTLVHAMSAEWIWLERWNGVSPKSLWREDEFPTFASVRERWQRQEERMRAFLAGLKDEDVLRVVNYTNLKGQPLAYPLWQLMAHMVNHGTQHRAEAAAMLTELGHSPGDVDLVYFLPEWSGSVTGSA